MTTLQNAACHRRGANFRAITGVLWYNGLNVQRCRGGGGTPLGATPKELASMCVQRTTPSISNPDHESDNSRVPRWLSEVVDDPDCDHILVPVKNSGVTVHALVDRDDFAIVCPYSWNATTVHKTLYARASRRRGSSGPATIFMHRLILSLGPGDLLVDHINGNGLDNRRSNLRPCTSSQNQANRHHLDSLATSGFRGVSWDKSAKKWRAGIGINGKTYNLGRYESEVEAARAYDSVALEKYGVFARLNFPTYLPESETTP